MGVTEDPRSMFSQTEMTVSQHPPAEAQSEFAAGDQAVLPQGLSSK